MANITFRTDDETDKAIADLMADGGYTEKSAALRDAIMVARKQQRIERLRAETSALAADPHDRAEAQAVLAEMEAFRAW
jgi:Arc/MetJ-type ribon-helix-helix transcriptional regulator